MTGTGEPTITGAGQQTAEKPSEELVPGTELGLGKEHEAQGEQGLGEESAERRRQRRLLRELALRALI